MGIILARAIRWFAEVLITLLFLRAVLSWFARNPYSSLGKAYQTIIRITEPVVNPCRTLLYRLKLDTGMLDFSVFLAMIFVELISNVLIRLILGIFY